MRDEDDEPKELPPLFIRERMKAKGITGVVAADRMKTTPATVSRLLNGQRQMTLGWLYAFAKALETPIASLFRDPDTPDMPITGKSEIFAFLERIEKLTNKDRIIILDTIMKDIEFNTLREHIQSGDLSEPESLRRVPSSSRKQ